MVSKNASVYLDSLTQSHGTYQDNWDNNYKKKLILPVVKYN